MRGSQPGPLPQAGGRAEGMTGAGPTAGPLPRAGGRAEGMTGAGPTAGPYSNVPTTHNRGTEADMHETLKKEIYKQGQDKDVGFRFTSSSSSTDTAPISRNIGFNSRYIQFVSTNKIESSRTDIGELTYSIPVFNNNNAISNIVKFRIEGFYFPRLEGPATQPDRYFFRRVYILVKPLPTNSVLGPNAAQHHFEMNVDNINSIAVELQPVGKEGERGEFVFDKPVTQLSDITFQFLVPGFGTNALTPLVLPRDTLAVRTIPNTNPAQFEVLGGLTTEDIGPIGVQPAPGVAVYFAGLNTSNNTVNQEVNSPLGQYITTINSLTVFTVQNLNFTVNPLNVSAFPVAMLIARNRIAFTVEFQSTNSGTITNFIDYTHH